MKSEGATRQGTQERREGPSARGSGQEAFQRARPTRHCDGSEEDELDRRARPENGRRERRVAELEASLKEKTKAYEKIKSKFDAAKEEFEKQSQEADSKEELLQTLQTGVASKEGQENGYQGQLQDARSRATAAVTEQEQAKIKIAHLEKRIKEEEPRAKKAKEANAGLLKELDVAEIPGAAAREGAGQARVPARAEEEMYRAGTHLSSKISATSARSPMR